MTAANSMLPICAAVSVFSLWADPCSDAKSYAKLTGPREPGQRMTVRGRVVKPDGRTPAANIVMYVYQTGADGEYRNDASGAPRLRAWLRTDAEGRYEYSTIRPGPYPNGRIAAHVHVQFWGGGVPAQWNTELLFEDDAAVAAEERRRSRGLGEFAFVQKPEMRDGVLFVTHNFRLKATGDRLENNVAHGMRACGGS